MSIESGGLLLIIMAMGLFQNSNLWKNLSEYSPMYGCGDINLQFFIW
ncbi:MAG: hypothetical protein Q6363_010760 [Candidatus Njordarchaeota archaeon]